MRGVEVTVKDGTVRFEEGESITFSPDGELVVTDEAGVEVARFGPGNWLGAQVLHHVAGP